VARPLAQYLIDDGLQAQRRASHRRVDRSAAMAFGAAIASLLVATVVVNQSSSALQPQGSIAGNSFEVGTITLSDDDEGQSLVNLSNMVPSHPAEGCIDVTYNGTVLPVEVSLQALADGPLARYVEVAIDKATGGGFGRCGELTDVEPIYRGTLADLAAGEPLTVATYRNSGEHTSYRFHFTLRDDAGAIGQATTADFRWEARPV
jgi:hypothetical protein